MGLPAPTAVDDARRITARRAAVADAQRNLLEVIEGVTLYGGVTTGTAMATNDAIRTHVTGVLRGAVVLDGSESWDPDSGTYELTMIVPVGEVRRSLPRLRLAADNETILVFGTDEAGSPSAPREPSAGGNGSFEARDDTASVAQHGSVTFDVLHNDSGDPSTFGLVVTVGVAHGTLLGRGGGRFTYQHGGDRDPVDGFTYMLTDGQGTTSVATVRIEILLSDEKDEAPREPGAPSTTDGARDDAPPEPVDADPDASSPAGSPAAAEAPDEPSEERAPEQPPAESPVAPAPVPTPPPPPPPAPTVPGEAIGGRALPIRGELPTVIVLDATGYEFDRPFALDISSTSGELIYELAEVHYVRSLEEVRQPGAEVMSISAVGHNLVSVVVDEGQAVRLRALLAERDYVAAGDLWIAGGR